MKTIAAEVETTYTEEMIYTRLDNVLSPIIRNLSVGDYNRLLHDVTHLIWEASAAPTTGDET